MNLYPNLFTNLLKTFTKPLGVGINYVDVVIVVVVISLMSPEMVLGPTSTEPVVDASL